MSLESVTDAQFASRVLAATTPVLVDVWAEWCAPCKALTPVLEQLAGQFAGRVAVVGLDADANLETVTTYGVRALPTLLLFDRGVVVERMAGAQSQSRLAAMLEQLLARRETGAPAVPVAAVPAPTPRPASRTPSAAEQEATALVASAEPLLVFKHSATCSISIGVKRSYDAFVHANPSLATRVVVVQTERPLSNALESVLQVQHESPQAILVQQGRVLWHASHRRITESSLQTAVAAASVLPV